MQLACAGMLAVALGGLIAPAWSFELEGLVAAEARGFFERGDYSSRHAVGSLVLEPELLWRSANDQALVIVHPFYRWESEDERREHFDLRELALELRRGEVDLRIGIRKVFWGVAESQHVVDVINQTDLVESLDLEEKLGQPMLSLSWRPDSVSFDLYLLPYFREREFKQPGTRLGPPARVLDAQYESADERRHLDFAARAQFAAPASVDVALSYFRGTNREPALQAAERAGAFVRIPYYSIIDQTGLELQWIRDSLAVKGELFYRAEQGEDALRAVYGFEYTLFQLRESRQDLGLIIEHNYDSRRATALTALQNDLFLGARLTFNDEASSELIAGVFFDADHHSSIGKVEWKSRWSDAISLGVEAYLFHGTQRHEPHYASRRDSFVELVFQYRL